MLKKFLVFFSLIFYSLFFLVPVNVHAAVSKICPDSIEGYTEVLKGQPVEQCAANADYCYVPSSQKCYAPPGAPASNPKGLPQDKCDEIEKTLKINPPTDPNTPPSTAPDGSTPLDFSTTNDTTIITANLAPGGFDSTTITDIHVLISSGIGASGSTVIPIGKFLGSIPGNGAPVIGAFFDLAKKVPDITLPFGIKNDDSTSGSPDIDSTGIATFQISPLHDAGTHSIKLVSSQQSEPLCVFNKKISIVDAANVSQYICQLRSSLNGCQVGAGNMCPGGKSIKTAIGCIPTDPKGLIDGLLGFITRAAGGVALLVMALASFSMITSQGNAEELKKAQERFRDAVIGLLFIILAVTILQIIGVDILQIPGLAR